MWKLVPLAIITLWPAAPTLAQAVDPNLVGMWKLQWVGPDIYWQIREEGVFRVIGAGIRPNDHWGTMRATAGKWSSKWALGVDGGQYELNGDRWDVTGNLGPGTWVRVWPGGATSTGSCPYIDTNAVERVFASAVQVRPLGETCEFTADKVGARDRLTILVERVDPITDPARSARAGCARGRANNPLVRCVSRVGDSAFVRTGVLVVYSGNRKASISLKMQPESPFTEADSTSLARSALGL